MSATEQEEKPKWLLELENRKRKPKLAHETGAGAPCLTCESACPGLDLHFWRKICKNCKCRGDEHDFDDDEFPQFELLFGPNIKNKRNRSVLLRVNDKKQVQAETPFEWVPPDTTKELAADYMKALPVEKLPIKGSAGAALRKQQLQKQLPLHDIDHKACDGLSENERIEFEKYLDNLKNCAGQGKVSKLMTIRPFDASLMTPANATDVQLLSPQHSQQLLNPNGGLNLRTPSSFISKVPQTHPKSTLPNTLNNSTIPIAPKVDLVRGPHLQFANETNPRLGKYHHSLANFPNDGHLAEASNVPGTYHLGEYHSTVSSNQNNHLAEDNPVSSKLQYSNIPYSIASGEYAQSGTVHEGSTLFSGGVNVQPGQYHHASTNLSNNGHLDRHQPPVSNNQNSNIMRDNLLPYEFQYSKNPSSIACSGDYTPIGTAYKDSKPLLNEPKGRAENIGSQIEQNFEFSSDLPSNALLAEQMLSEALLPPSAVNANDIVGSSLDEKKLTYIREKLSDKYSNKNDPMLARELDYIGYSPSLSTSEEIRNVAERVKEFQNKSNHSNENNKNQLPSQLPYTARSECLQAELNTSLPVQSNVIHSEELNIPVFPDYAVGASVALQNPENINQLQQEMEGMTMNVTKVHQCHKCEENIHCGAVVVTAEKIKEAVWHPGCFVCSACDELLVDLVYFTHKGKLYCARDLAELLEIPRCFACDELIFVRKYTVAEGHNYHVKHFCCWDCDIPLAGKQYISENDRPLCLPCYQNNYAKTCDACNIVIAADQQGVAIKHLNFHATDACFCCYTCKKNLLDGQVAIKENRLLCSKECIAEFLHRRALGR